MLVENSPKIYLTTEIIKQSHPVPVCTEAWYTCVVQTLKIVTYIWGQKHITLNEVIYASDMAS